LDGLAAATLEAAAKRRFGRVDFNVAINNSSQLT
jgi:hypothetical protein